MDGNVWALDGAGIMEAELLAHGTRKALACSCRECKRVRLITWKALAPSSRECMRVHLEHASLRGARTGKHAQNRKS